MSAFLDFFYRRPVSVLMVLAAFLLLGMLCLSRMPLSLFPPLKAGCLTVVTAYADAAPDEVERLITVPLEDSLAGLTGLDRLESVSQTGLSVIHVYLRAGVDPDLARIEAKEKLDLTRGRLPQEAGDAMVLKYDPGRLPLLELECRPKDIGLLMRHRLLFRRVLPALKRVPGVALTQLQGYRRPEVHVSLRPLALDRYQVSAHAVIEAVRGANTAQSAGTVERDGREYTVRAGERFHSLDDLRRTIIRPNPQGTPLRIADVASVRVAPEKERDFYQSGNEPALALRVYAEAGSNAVRTAAAARRRLTVLNEDLPAGMRWRVVRDRSRTIQRTVRSLMLSLLLGMLLASAVVTLFSGSWRRALPVVAGFPLAISLTLAGMYLSGISINLISLGGLALGIGMLVDNSIVLVDVVGEVPPGRSRAGAVAAVLPALVSGAATTAAVFLPVVFLGSVVGQIFRQLALTVCYSLAAGLAVSVLIIPSFSRGGGARPTWVRSLERRYLKGLRYSVLHPRRLLLAGAALIMTATAALVMVPKEILPALQRGRWVVRGRCETGTPIRETRAAARALGRALQRAPRVREVRARGGHHPDDLSSPGDELHGDQFRLYINADASLSHGDLRRLAGTSPLAERLTIVSERSLFARAFRLGDDRGSWVLRNYRRKDLRKRLARLMDGPTGQLHIYPSPRTRVESLQVRPRRHVMAELGVTSREVVDSLWSVLADKEITRFRLAGFERPINIRQASVQDRRRLLLLPVRFDKRGTVRLGQVAELTRQSAPRRLLRSKRRAAARLSLNALSRPRQADVRRQIREAGAVRHSRVRRGRENLRQLAAAMLAAVVIVFMVLSAQFESLRKALFVMAVVPVGVLGALPLVWLTGKSLNVLTLLGLVVLCGITVNNAIMLFDELERRGGHSAAAAAKRRLRPVLMTTLTTIAGLLPVALTPESRGGLQAPLAVAVCGGLTVSTVVTLIIVPLLYRRWFAAHA